MRQLYQLVFSCCLIFLLGCGNQEVPEGKFAFYHWKSKASSSPTVKEALSQTNANQLYLHYFDVDSKDSYQAYPVSVLTDVDEEYKDLRIVPVIFIANRVFQQEYLNVEYMSKRITSLVNQISKEHFGTTIKELQLDCDWTGTTRKAYFELIDLLKKEFDISVTIRLHQIKYQEKTGVPPVKRGTLMLYNVGKLDDFEQNSILEADIVKSYVNENTDYPLYLNVALPLFSQTVVKNLEGSIRLIRGADKEALDNDPTHFEKLSDGRYQVKSEILYHGLYLFEGYQLKLERSLEKEIIESYQLLQTSKLRASNVIFYHLDDATLQSVNIEKLVQEL